MVDVTPTVVDSAVIIPMLAPKPGVITSAGNSTAAATGAALCMVNPRSCFPISPSRIPSCNKSLPRFVAPLVRSLKNSTPAVNGSFRCCSLYASSIPETFISPLRAFSRNS